MSRPPQRPPPAPYRPPAPRPSSSPASAPTSPLTPPGEHQAKMAETSVPMSDTSSPGTQASPPVVHPVAQFGRAPVEPDLLGSGIVSGPGNHGTANTAQLQGHAGTGADRLSIPRNLKFGTGTVTP